ncbi:hypothetical protein Esti_005267 [Eimeria stiedai]
MFFVPFSLLCLLSAAAAAAGEQPLPAGAVLQLLRVLLFSSEAGGASPAQVSLEEPPGIGSQLCQQDLPSLSKLSSMPAAPEVWGPQQAVTAAAAVAAAESFAEGAGEESSVSFSVPDERDAAAAAGETPQQQQQQERVAAAARLWGPWSPCSQFNSSSSSKNRKRLAVQKQREKARAAAAAAVAAAVEASAVAGVAAAAALSDQQQQQQQQQQQLQKQQQQGSLSPPLPTIVRPSPALSPLSPVVLAALSLRTGGPLGAPIGAPLIRPESPLRRVRTPSATGSWLSTGSR